MKKIRLIHVGPPGCNASVSKDHAATVFKTNFYCSYAQRYNPDEQQASIIAVRTLNLVRKIGLWNYKTLSLLEKRQNNALLDFYKPAVAVIAIPLHTSGCRILTEVQMEEA
jgi:hypothetical protein